MKVQGYSFGRIEVGGRSFNKDVIIYPDHVECPWRRARGHELSVEDIRGILELAPARLVIGTGSSGRMRVPSSVLDVARQAVGDIVVERTDQAVKIFNEDTRGGTVAALHLTC